jgi:molecular chaperone GrpE
VTERRTGEPHHAAPPTSSRSRRPGGDGGLGEASTTEVEEPVASPHASEQEQTDAAETVAAPSVEEAPEGAVDGAERAETTEAGAPAKGTDDAEGTDDVEGAELGQDSPVDPASLEQALAERTADLQRLQAEYLNYKRRVDRDRELVRENATFAALAPIVEVLDTIDRARDSARSLGGDLDEGFRAVADQLERVVAHAGLVKYGEPGDAFDPRLHEALSHIGEDPDVEVTTCKVVAKAGYRIGERVVRAAQVLVVDPANG